VKLSATHDSQLIPRRALMTFHPGSDVQPPAQEPPAQQPPAQPEKKSNAKKWLSGAGTVAVVGGIAAVRFLGFGGGETEVGDCIQESGDAKYEVVDCDSSDADYKVVGIDDAEMTYADFQADDLADVCLDFPNTEYVLWNGEILTETGTILCSEPV
jgi:hypothetical protein